LQKRIEELKTRMNRNAKVQEGEAPIEDPNLLRFEFDRSAAQLLDLVQRINRTNTITPVDGDPSLMVSDAIAMRDSLRLRHGAYASLCEAAIPELNRYSRTEIKSVPTVDVRALRAEADAIAVQHRELDARIQATNWLADLVD
jgi:hypothetical protein